MKSTLRGLRGPLRAGARFLASWVARPRGGAQRASYGPLEAFCGVAIATVLLAASASANDVRPFTYKWYKQDLYWSQYHCFGEYRPEGCRRYRIWRYQRRHYVPPRDPGAVCHPLLASTGDQAQSKDNAETLALRSWQGRVRFHYGERYIDLANARDVRLACSPSSVADTVGGKIQDKLFGVSHFRCEISARPCRAEARPMRRNDD